MYIVWTEDGEMYGPEPGILIDKGPEKYTVLVDGGEKYVPASQVSDKEEDLFKKYPDKMEVAGFVGDDVSPIKAEQMEMYASSGLTYHPIKLVRPIYFVSKYYLSMLNQAQSGNFECADASLKKFLEIDVRDSRRSRELGVECDTILNQYDPYNCVIYALANLFRHHPRIVDKAYPGYLLNLLCPSKQGTCPELPQDFWLVGRHTKIGFLTLTNVLYVLAKKYPREFKLFFDTSTKFKVERGVAYMMQKKLNFTQFIDEILSNRQYLANLDGMSIIVMYADEHLRYAAHAIAIVRCANKLWLMDSNAAERCDLESMDECKKRYKEVYGVFWWSWPENGEDKWLEMKQRKFERIRLRLQEKKSVI